MLIPSVKKFATALLTGIAFIGACAQEPGAQPGMKLAGELGGVRVPENFSIQTLAEVPKARSLAMGAAGTLFVSAKTPGEVYAVKNALADSAASREVKLILAGLRTPNGLDFYAGDLYVAEAERVLRYADAESHLNQMVEPEVVIEGLPTGDQHRWKYMRIGPDAKIYVAIGSPCNVCDEPDYGVIMRFNLDGSTPETIARGIRNSVGFDWHPVNNELWFTDNNRDMLGDDLPPGELNRLAPEGQHFGFPFCHGKDIVEPEKDLAALGSCAESTPPAQLLGPHVAPLGMVFYDGKQFPDEYHNQIFIAEHGSWNRSEKIGYRVSLVTVESGQGASYSAFADGWLDNGDVTGRPVDVIVAPDGSLLISDDYAGRIYRISYSEPQH